MDDRLEPKRHWMGRVQGEGNDIPLKNLSLVRTLMENSETAKIVGLSFTAGVAVGWFLHGYMLKARNSLVHCEERLLCLRKQRSY